MLHLHSIYMPWSPLPATSDFSGFRAKYVDEKLYMAYQEPWSAAAMSPLESRLSQTPGSRRSSMLGLPIGVASTSPLGKRDRENQRRSNPVNRSSSHFRGVTHHARTNRYESHIWDEKRQIYLGGFYNESQAALVS
jgi:hypothetical protein